MQLSTGTTKGRLHDVASELLRLQEFSMRVAAKPQPGGVIKLCMMNWGVTTDISYKPVIDDNWLRSRKWRTLLGLEIAFRALLHKERGQHKHLAVAIVGQAGAGKTTYAILSAVCALMKAYGMDYDKAVSTVSEFITFTADETVEILEYLVENRSWIPFIIIDDAGAQISKYWLWLRERYWAHMFSIFDQLKDWVGVLILTARSLTSIAARLREIVDIVIEATEVNANGVILDVFWWFRASDYRPSLTKQSKMKRLLYVDAMPASVRMPESLWNRMVEARREVAKSRLEMIEEEMFEEEGEEVVEGDEGGED